MFLFLLFDIKFACIFWNYHECLRLNFRNSLTPPMPRPSSRCERALCDHPNSLCRLRCRNLTFDARRLHRRPSRTDLRWTRQPSLKLYKCFYVGSMYYFDANDLLRKSSYDSWNGYISITDKMVTLAAVNVACNNCLLLLSLSLCGTPHINISLSIYLSLCLWLSSTLYSPWLFITDQLITTLFQFLFLPQDSLLTHL